MLASASINKEPCLVRERKALAKQERIALGVSRQANTLLQRAAALRDTSVTKFVLDSGLAAAAETLADRCKFSLDDKQWKAFVAALDAPSKRKPPLEALLRTKSDIE